MVIDSGVPVSPSAPAADVAVVIVNYGRLADTADCVASIRQAPDGHALPILLVDNGSGDPAVADLAQAWPNITLRLLPRNLGYVGGFNAGIEAALRWPVRSLLLLNNDTLVPAGSLACLVQALDLWDIAVPKITYADQSNLIWAAGAAWRRFPPGIVMRGFRRPEAPAYNVAGPLDYATGCALLVKRAVLEAVGGFDTRYGSYMEDYDYCYRLRAAGFRLGYVPQAVIRHKVSQTLGENTPAKWHLLGRNSVLFYRTDRRFPARVLWAYLAWVMVREVLKGQAPVLPHFARGVREGLTLLKTNPQLPRGRIRD